MDKVREGGLDSIDDDTMDTLVRDCDTLLLGKLSDLPTYKRFDWALSRGSKSEREGRLQRRVNGSRVTPVRCPASLKGRLILTENAGER